MTEIYLHGEVYPGLGDVVRALLPTDHSESVTIRINSFGGDLIEALGIRSILLDRPNSVARIDGIAASAATVIACGCAWTEAVTGTAWQVHNPWSVGVGDAVALRDQAADLETLAGGVVAIYAKKTGRHEQEIVEEMRAGRMMTAEEAWKLGYVDAVVEGSSARHATDTVKATLTERIFGGGTAVSSCVKPYQSQAVACARAALAAKAASDQAEPEPVPQEEPEAAPQAEPEIVAAILAAIPSPTPDVAVDTVAPREEWLALLSEDPSAAKVFYSTHRTRILRGGG